MTQKNTGDNNSSSGLPSSLRDVIAALRGRKKPSQSGGISPKPDNAGDIFPHSTAAEKKRQQEAAKKAAEQKAIEEARNMEVGKHCRHKGVFIGTWTPTDEAAVSLQKTFNLFAAPEDIGVLQNFNEAVQLLGSLKNWHGYDGFDHQPNGAGQENKVLYDALRDGSYQGEWFIPPKEVVEDKLYPNRHKGALKGGFITATRQEDLADWYWSSTVHSRNKGTAMWGMKFSKGFGGWNRHDLRLSTRYVRAELRL